MFCKLLISWKFEGRYFSKYPSFVFWVKKKKKNYNCCFYTKTDILLHSTRLSGLNNVHVDSWILFIIIPMRIFQLAKNSKVQVMLRLLSKCWHKIEWLDVDLFHGMRIFLEALHSPRTRKQTFHDFFFWF